MHLNHNSKYRNKIQYKYTKLCNLCWWHIDVCTILYRVRETAQSVHDTYEAFTILCKVRWFKYCACWISQYITHSIMGTCILCVMCENVHNNMCSRYCAKCQRDYTKYTIPQKYVDTWPIALMCAGWTSQSRFSPFAVIIIFTLLRRIPARLWTIAVRICIIHWCRVRTSGAQPAFLYIPKAFR